jgi:hypothetical protein
MRSVPGGFWQWISSMHSDDVCGMIAILSVFSVAAITVVCVTIHAIHKSRSENALKRELLDRGMTADEIATVISAKPGKVDPQRMTRH